MIFRSVAFLPALSLLAALVLTGCGLGTPAASTPVHTAGTPISGNVHGGQQPVAGAHVYLIGVSSDNSNGGGYKAYSMLGTYGPGDPLIAELYMNAAGSGTDSSGNKYVITDAGGNWTVNGSAVENFTGTLLPNSTYACDSNVLVYALAVGGNPGLSPATVNNSAISLAAVLGPCAGTTSQMNTLGASRYVTINEATTVAAAYALAGYMTGPMAVTYSGTALGATGLTNAGNNAAQLASSTTGAAIAALPNNVGTAPQASVNTLADILSACVNTATSNSPNCSSLFKYATADGTATGTQPADTLTAALNIAHHPGGFTAGTSTSVAQLFGLASAIPAFAPTLPTAPNDFTLAIQYGTNGNYLSSSGVPAVDASGNVWFASTVPVSGTSSYIVAELSPVGTGIGLFSVSHPPAQVAIDPRGDAWVAQRSGGVVTKIVPGGIQTDYPYRGASNDDGHQIAIDGSGNVFLSDYSNFDVYEISNSGAAIGNTSGVYSDPSFNIALLSNATALTTGSFPDLQKDSTPFIDITSPFASVSNNAYSGASAIAVDSSQNIWVVATQVVVKTTPASVVSSFTGGGLNTTTPGGSHPSPWLAIDGAGNVWVSNYTGVLSESSSTGVALSPAAGLYGSSTAACKGQGATIDGSGDVWVGCDSATTPVLEYIGLATPVATPLLPGNFGVKP